MWIVDLAELIIDKLHKSHREVFRISRAEEAKSPSRTEIINFLLSNRENTTYLEIGVRNPSHNFNHIQADVKYSVDPGVEFEGAPVDFNMTSDEFFEKIDSGEILEGVLFDVIFVDGLHLAHQVEKDLENSLKHLKEDGFVVLHDCNPPTEWHARETYLYKMTPAGGRWNGTTWKAFAKARSRESLSSCCIDSDYGVGIVTRQQMNWPVNTVENPYFEFSLFDRHRKKVLNLISFEELVKSISEQ